MSKIEDSDTAEAGAVWRRLPRTWGIRRRLKLSIPQFAARYHIPADLVEAWEAGRAEPDAATQAYLKVIALDPERVAVLLAGAEGPEVSGGVMQARHVDL